MGMFRKRSKASDGRDQTVDTDTNDTDGSQSTPPMNEELEEKLHEVMMDNLEMMRDLVFRIRDDPEFAKGIYKECPRLQHLLNRYPDLRPIFEDPKLVRINFETVYRNAGGILPEDEVDKKKKSWLIWFVNSPIFKVLKLLLFVKKLMACIAGGGIAMLTGCFVGCCFEDALDEIGEDGDADMDDPDDDFGNDPGKEALNRAADHMEDPDVQEQMEALMEDPDNMEEAIANDSELQALRESNALCDELMNDPETMKVLTDPDNLRALGEAPNLIESDFIDPDSFMPEDIETGGFESGDAAFDGLDSGGDVEFGDTDADFEYEVDGDADDGFDGETEIEAEEGDVEADGGEAEAAEGEGEDGFGEGEEEDDGWWDDAELEEQDNPDADANTANKGKAAANKKGAAAAAANEAGKGGGYRGIMASVGVAATELIAAQVVGQVFDVAGMGALMGGGGGDLGGLDDIGDGLDDAVNDDVADAAEDAVDETDEQADEAKDSSKSDGMDADLDDPDDDGKKRDTGAIAGGAAGGAAVGGGAGYAMSGSGDGTEKEEGEGEGEGDKFDDEEGSVEEEKKKSRFGFIGSFASTIATAAKEHVATAILGDDFGEALVERWEERGGDDESKKDGDDDGDGDEEEVQPEEQPQRRGFFRRKK